MCRHESYPVLGLVNLDGSKFKSCYDVFLVRYLPSFLLSFMCVRMEALTDCAFIITLHSFFFAHHFNLVGVCVCILSFITTPLSSTFSISGGGRQLQRFLGL